MGFAALNPSADAVSGASTRPSRWPVDRIRMMRHSRSGFGGVGLRAIARGYAGHSRRGAPAWPASPGRARGPAAGRARQAAGIPDRPLCATSCEQMQQIAPLIYHLGGSRE
jgi:hypothetical protein